MTNNPLSRVPEAYRPRVRRRGQHKPCFVRAVGPTGYNTDEVIAIDMFVTGEAFQDPCYEHRPTIELYERLTEWCDEYLEYSPRAVFLTKFDPRVGNLATYTTEDLWSCFSRHIEFINVDHAVLFKFAFPNLIEFSDADDEANSLRNADPCFTCRI